MPIGEGIVIVGDKAVLVVGQAAEHLDIVGPDGLEEVIGVAVADLQLDDLAADHGLVLIVLGVGLVVLLGLGAGVAHHEDDFVVAVHVGVLDVDHLGHAALVEDNGVGVRVTLHVGHILDAGVDGVVVAVVQQEDSAAVGIVVVGRKDLHGGGAGLDLQTGGVEGIILQVDAVVASLGQSVQAVAVLGVGHDVALQSLTGLLSAIILVRAVGIQVHLQLGGVGEQQGGAEVGVIAVLVVGGANAHHVGVILSHGVSVQMDHIAIGVQIGHGLGVHIIGVQLVAGIHVLGVGVAGAVQGEVVLVLHLGDSAFHGLSLDDRLDLVVGVGVDDHVVLRKSGGSKLVVAGVGGAVHQVGQGDGAVLLIDLVDLSHIAVDDGDGNFLLLGVNIDLSQNAVAGHVLASGLLQEAVSAGTVVIQVVAVEGVLIGLAVGVNGPVIVLSGSAAHIVVQGLGRDLGSVGVGSGVGHADDDVVVSDALVAVGDVALVVQRHVGQGAGAPHGAGTAEVILVIHVHQVEVLVAQGLLVVELHAVGPGAAGVEVDVEGVVVLNGDSLGQGVEHQLGHVVAGQAGIGGQLQIAVHAQLSALGGGGQHPVVAEVSGALEVAQSAAQHQHGLRGGHGGAGVELAVAHAGHDAQAGAQVHIALRPVGDVGEHAGLRELVDVHTGAIQHGADDDRHLGAGDYVLGTKGPVLVAVEHADLGGDRHGVLIDDLILIGKIVDALSAGSDHHHAQEHGGSQSNAESALQVSHWIFLLLYLANESYFLEF